LYRENAWVKRNLLDSQPSDAYSPLIIELRDTLKDMKQRIASGVMGYPTDIREAAYAVDADDAEVSDDDDDDESKDQVDTKKAKHAEAARIELIYAPVINNSTKLRRALEAVRRAGIVDTLAGDMATDVAEGRPERSAVSQRNYIKGQIRASTWLVRQGDCSEFLAALCGALRHPDTVAASDLPHIRTKTIKYKRGVQVGEPEYTDAVQSIPILYLKSVMREKERKRRVTDLLLTVPDFPEELPGFRGDHDAVLHVEDQRLGPVTFVVYRRAQSNSVKGKSNRKHLDHGSYIEPQDTIEQDGNVHRLNAIVLHMGDTNYAHYACFLRFPEGWVWFDDLKSGLKFAAATLAELIAPNREIDNLTGGPRVLTHGCIYYYVREPLK
jgi:hypothetical protein